MSENIQATENDFVMGSSNEFYELTYRNNVASKSIAPKHVTRGYGTFWEPDNGF